MPVIKVGTKNAAADTGFELEQASDTPKLNLMKDAVTSVQDVARNYYDRNVMAANWWRARWDGQTVDGRRWASPGDERDVWPWPGASDTRVRLCERLVSERSSVCRYALMNAKVGARSSRPLTDMRDPQIATKLLNWLLYTHSASDIWREQDLMLAWRHGYGSAITAVEWDQLREVRYVKFNLPSLGEFVQAAAGSFADEMQRPNYARKSDRQMAIQFMQALAQTKAPLLELTDMIMDPAYDADLVRLLQAVSPIVTKRQAEKSLLDLRQMAYTEIPIPRTFKSRPRRTTLRPMIDVLFPELTDDLQRAAFVDRVEYVRPSELTDRIETANYDPGFVNEALTHRGPSKSGGYGDRTAALRSLAVDDAMPRPIVGPGGTMGGQRTGKDEWQNDIELHHFYMVVRDRGVPVLFKTVFHMDVEAAAAHGPCEYEHGQMIFHAHRNETDDRPILSSRGIPETAYTWEQELKRQRDGRVDRSDLVLRPPIFTTAYEELQKYKVAYTPGAWVPVRRFDTIEKDKPPMWDPGSIEIDKTIVLTALQHFGLFGAAGVVDPMLSQLRRQELVDTILAEEKPIVAQMWQLTQQYLPSSKVARVVGPLQRPFEVDREEIQGQYDITMTADVRQQDPEFLKQFMQFATNFAGLDTIGVADRRELLVMVAEAFSYDFADRVIKPGDAATQQEQQDEQKTFSLIVGSGRPQPLPMGGNYQLRLQTLENEIQTAMQTDPDFPKRVQAFPGIMQVLQSRIQFFQRQIGQQQNAQIGRMQVEDPFTKGAPVTSVADFGGMLR